MTSDRTPSGGIWDRRYQALEAQNLDRKLRVSLGPTAETFLTRDGERLHFCSNDYLGLANHPQIAEAMCRAMEQYGAGTGASRLISGHTELHAQFEAAWAQWMGYPAALSFPSGYQANVGAISALTAPGDIIFSDERVHASIIDGCRLSRAQVVIFRHNDLQHLAELLATHTVRDGVRLIVTDAVFSMDGDETPLGALCALAEQHGAQLYLDEAHSVGIMGPEGRGLAHREALAKSVAVHVSTFGKAWGLCGAMVATSSLAVAIIRSRARSFLFTTAAPAFLSAGLLRGWDIVRQGDALRQRLQSNIAVFCERAANLGLPLIPSTSPIQPLVIGSAQAALRVSQALWERGIFVQAVRPPTVPEGTSRLRITITAAHETAHIDALLSALSACVPPSGDAPNRPREDDTP
ncbi:MAG: 8-amino-7-oxononanoate synthase [Myxococcales bacterium]|nr:8-amino-7-oxononanoate synthase [Myxococcales bacterium]